MKTKNIKAPRSTPAMKPYPCQRLIRRSRESGLLGMNRAIVAGRPGAEDRETAQDGHPREQAVDDGRRERRVGLAEDADGADRGHGQAS
jgi:hypothetical protein